MPVLLGGAGNRNAFFLLLQRLKSSLSISREGSDEGKREGKDMEGTDDRPTVPGLRMQS